MTNPYVLVALISTIRDIKEGPESSFYLPLMGSLHVDTFQQLLSTIQKLGLCTIEHHYVRFTIPAKGSKGEELLAAITETEAKARIT